MSLAAVSSSPVDLRVAGAASGADLAENLILENVFDATAANVPFPPEAIKEALAKLPLDILVRAGRGLYVRNIGANPDGGSEWTSCSSAVETLTKVFSLPSRPIESDEYEAFLTPVPRPVEELTDSELNAAFEIALAALWVLLEIQRRQSKLPVAPGESPFRLGARACAVLVRVVGSGGPLLRRRACEVLEQAVASPDAEAVCAEVAAALRAVLQQPERSTATRGLAELVSLAALYIDPPGLEQGAPPCAATAASGLQRQRAALSAALAGFTLHSAIGLPGVGRSLTAALLVEARRVDAATEASTAPCGAGSRALVRAILGGGGRLVGRLPQTSQAVAFDALAQAAAQFEREAKRAACRPGGGGGAAMRLDAREGADVCAALSTALRSGSTIIASAALGCLARLPWAIIKAEEGAVVALYRELAALASAPPPRPPPARSSRLEAVLRAITAAGGLVQPTSALAPVSLAPRLLAAMDTLKWAFPALKRVPPPLPLPEPVSRRGPRQAPPGAAVPGAPESVPWQAAAAGAGRPAGMSLLRLPPVQQQQQQEWPAPGVAPGLGAVPKDGKTQPAPPLLPGSTASKPEADGADADPPAPASLSARSGSSSGRSDASDPCGGDSGSDSCGSAGSSPAPSPTMGCSEPSGSSIEGAAGPGCVCGSSVRCCLRVSPSPPCEPGGPSDDGWANRIAVAAYYRWQAGLDGGSAVAHWLAAEAGLQEQLQQRLGCNAWSGGNLKRQAQAAWECEAGAEEPCKAGGSGACHSS